jgi:hypothetical protein
LPGLQEDPEEERQGHEWSQGFGVRQSWTQTLVAPL